MLAVRLTSDAMKPMTFYDTLETLAFRGANYVNAFTLSKNVDRNSLTNIFFNGKIPEFFYKFFGGSACFGKMICFRFFGVFFVLVAKRKLEGIVTIAVLRSYLCNHAGTRFDDGARGLPARRIEDARHPNFFADNTFHFLTVFPRKVYKTDQTIKIGLQSWFITDLFFLHFSGPSASEVPATNKPRRACLYFIADLGIMSDFADPFRKFSELFFHNPLPDVIER